MSTLVVIQMLCDVCGVASVDGDPGITSLRVTRGKDEYEVDLCSGCLDKTRMLSAMRPVKKSRTKRERVVAAEAANEAEAPAKAKYKVKRGTFPCPDCDYVGTSANAVAAHSRKHKRGS